MSSPLRYVLDGIHCEPRFFTVPSTTSDRMTRRPSPCSVHPLSPGPAARRSALAAVPAGWARLCPSRPPTALDKRALQEFRVLLLDQRGTGHSSPISAEALAQLTAPQQAKYLSQFRADSIVRDAEYIREVLSPGAPGACSRPELRRLLQPHLPPCSRTVCTRSTSPAGGPISTVPTRSTAPPTSGWPTRTAPSSRASPRPGHRQPAGQPPAQP